MSTPLTQQFKLSLEQVPVDEVEQAFMDKVPCANLVRSIMYSMVRTRPDLAHSISVVSRFHC